MSFRGVTWPAVKWVLHTSFRPVVSNRLYGVIPTISTTMGLKSHWRNSIPNGHSQWAFGMILLPYLVKIAIYGTMHQVRCLATWPRNARHVLRHAHYIWSFPDYLPFIYLWDVAEIDSWTCVLEYDISFTRGQNSHHGTRQRLVPRWKFCPLV